MPSSPLTEVQRDAADDVLDAAENFLESLWSNGDGQSVRAAFWDAYLDTLDYYARARCSDA